MTGSERRISGAGVSHDPESTADDRTADCRQSRATATPATAAQAVPLYDTDRVWTLPNVLSFLRLAGAPLVLWLIVGPQADGLAVLVLALGGFTDWLDGYLARAWHQTSRIGQMLDPIADRLYILAVLIGLASAGDRAVVAGCDRGGTGCLRPAARPSSQDERLLVLTRALRGQGRHVQPALRVPLGTAWLRRGGLASVGLGGGMGIRDLGHSSVLVRGRPICCSDRPFAPLHTADPRPPSL